jgi:hypothetical protein
MPSFLVHTTEKVHGVYQITADSEQDARLAIETAPERIGHRNCVLYESLEVEIDKVEGSTWPN